MGRRHVAILADHREWDRRFVLAEAVAAWYLVVVHLFPGISYALRRLVGDLGVTFVPLAVLVGLVVLHWIHEIRGYGSVDGVDATVSTAVSLRATGRSIERALAVSLILVVLVAVGSMLLARVAAAPTDAGSSAMIAALGVLSIAGILGVLLVVLVAGRTAVAVLELASGGSDRQPDVP